MTKNLKIILSVLAGLIIIFFVSQRGQQQYSSKSSNVFNASAKDVHRFIIQNKSDAIEISRIDTLWKISGNDTLNIKQRSIDNFLDKVLPVMKGTLVSKNTEKWGKYSIDDSTGTHLALLDNDGNTLEYAVFGRSKSDYSRNYVRGKDDAHVYLTNESVLHFLNTSPTYWGEVPKPEPLTPPVSDTTIVK